MPRRTPEPGSLAAASASRGSGPSGWASTSGCTRRARRYSPTGTPASASRRRSAWRTGASTPPRSPPGAIPSEVFSEDKILKANGATLALKHYGPAHTDGDISVTFQEPDILHTGDTYLNGFYPFIDYSTGGSIDGTIRAADANFAAVGDGTIHVKDEPTGLIIVHDRGDRKFAGVLTDTELNFLAHLEAGALDELGGERSADHHGADREHP